MLWFKKINKKAIFKFGIAGGILEILYILLIAWVITNLDTIMNKANPIIGILSFLLLFVFSAAVSGFFVLGYPVYLGLQKRVQEAFLTLLITILTLLVGGVLIFSIIVLSR